MEREAGEGDKKTDRFHDEVCRYLYTDKKRSCSIPCEMFDPLDTPRTHEASVAQDQDSGISFIHCSSVNTFSNTPVKHRRRRRLDACEKKKGMPRNANGVCALRFSIMRWETMCPRDI